MLDSFSRILLASNQILEEIKLSSLNGCAQEVGLLGAAVRVCYMRKLQLVVAERPFRTSFPAIKSELEYRQLLVKSARDLEGRNMRDSSTHPLRELSEALLMFANVARLMESKTSVEDSALRPVGFLVQSGSPELPLLSAFPIAQRYLFATKLVPRLKPQFDNEASEYLKIRLSLPPDHIAAADAAITKVKLTFDSFIRSPYLNDLKEPL